MQEIERLRTENEQLVGRGTTLESHLSTYVKDNEALKKQIRGLGAQPVATQSVSLSSGEVVCKKVKPDYFHLKSNRQSYHLLTTEYPSKF